MRVTRYNVAIVVGVTASLLSGCAQAGTDPDPDPRPSYSYPFATSIIDDSRQDTEAPSAFQQRDPLPACPDITLEQGEAIEGTSAACLEEAGSEGAELAVVLPTVEGDPIVRFFRVGPDIDGMEIWEDWTRDTFGGGWHLGLCSEVNVSNPGDCTFTDF